MDNVKNKSSMELREKIRNEVISARILAKTVDEAVDSILLLLNVVGQSEQFNCLGGNYAKGIKPCEEWCGEDMCKKPSN